MFIYLFLSIISITSFHQSTSWGSNLSLYQLNIDEPSLVTLCQTTTFKSIHIRGVNGFLVFNTIPSITLDLSTHCNINFNDLPSKSTLSLKKCNSLQNEIKTCQSLGISILIILENTQQPIMSNNTDGLYISKQIWDLFLGGNSIYRPFGNVILDGVAIHIGDSSIGYNALATGLGTYFNTSTRKYILTGLVGCSYPDAYWGPTWQGLNDNVFDRSLPYFNYIIISGASSTCSYRNYDLFMSSILVWKTFLLNVNPKIKLLVYLASLNGYPAPGDWILPSGLTNVLRFINQSGLDGYYLDDAGRSLKSTVCVSTNETGSLKTYEISYYDSVAYATSCLNTLSANTTCMIDVSVCPKIDSTVSGFEVKSLSIFFIIAIVLNIISLIV